jgi:hypothetical protein
MSSALVFGSVMHECQLPCARPEMVMSDRSDISQGDDEEGGIEAHFVRAQTGTRIHS